MTAVLELDEIQHLLDTDEVVDAIEAGFVLYSQGRVTVPPVGFLHVDEPPGDVHIKYGAVEGDDVWVLKVASAFYRNPELGLSPADGVLMVFSQKTGALELVLRDRCWLTDMRTAAAGAVAARHLAPSSVDCIGIVGTGVQARMQLEMLRTVVDAPRCLIWGRDPGKVDVMISELQAREGMRGWGIDVQPADTLESLARACDLIVTTTSAKEPLIRVEHLRPGMHITAMGSDDDGKQELDVGVLARADRVVADSVAQCTQYGECVHAIQAGVLGKEELLELGHVIDDPTLGRTADDQITVADLTGVAIQDIQIAKMVRNAMP